MEKLLNWIEKNLLNATIQDRYVIIENIKYLLIDPKETDTNKVLFDENFELLLTEEERQLAENTDYLVFEFGDKFYYTDKLDRPELKEFRYLGKPKTIMPQIDLPFLGIHGGYDLCNGSRLYEDWCKKAKWLGISVLGIAEDNTLAGIVAFQNACDKYSIKSIIGETVVVQNVQGDRYRVKLYCKDRENGWKSLLQINSIINIDNKGQYIDEDNLLKLNSGLFCVLSPETPLEKVYNLYSLVFTTNLRYSLDFTEWDSQTKDAEILDNIQEYLTKYLDLIPAILISDGFYLEKDDSKIRRTLHLIGKHNFKNQSSNQYFKAIDDYFLEALEVFSDDTKCEDLITNIILNTIEFCNLIEQIKIITGKFYLPKYEMTLLERQRLIAENSEVDNESLLYSYIWEGFYDKVDPNQKDIYLDRIEKEMDVIKRGGFVDYFLILADIFKWCELNDIWTGAGRGSAAGCLISYLCGIVLIDPIKYNLLFERFLNEGRIGKKIKKECIIIEYPNQQGEIVLEFDERIIIFRHNEEKEIFASDLREGDLFINSKHRDLFKN